MEKITASTFTDVLYVPDLDTNMFLVCADRKKEFKASRGFGQNIIPENDGVCAIAK